MKTPNRTRIPQWARCVNCNGDIYPRTSYPTDEGYAHTHCPPAGKTAKTARIEDLAWLAHHGAGLTEAAQRCGWTKPETLDAWLRRNNAHATLQALLANEPRDWNHTISGESVIPDPYHARRKRAAA